MSQARLAIMLGVAVALVGAAASPAAAEPGATDADAATARELVARAQRHFDLGEYEEAVAGFREAYRLDPRPGLLYNLGQAYRLDGDCVNAAFMYRSFVWLAPDSKHRAMADQQLTVIADCERAQLDADARPDALDGLDPGTSNEPSGDAREPDPEVLTEIAMASPRHAGRGRGLRLAGIATAATGGLALGIGAYFSIDAARASRQVSDAYRDGGAWADLDAIDARGRRAEVAGASLLVTGTVAVAAGATLYALGWRAGHRATVVPTRGGGDVVVSWRF